MKTTIGHAAGSEPESKSILHYWFWFVLPYLSDVVGFSILPLHMVPSLAQAGILIGIFIIFANVAWGSLPDWLGYTSRWPRLIYVGLAIGKVPFWIYAYHVLRSRPMDAQHTISVLESLLDWVGPIIIASLVLNGCVTVHAFWQRATRIFHRQAREIEWLEGPSASFDGDDDATPPES